MTLPFNQYNRIRKAAFNQSTLVCFQFMAALRVKNTEALYVLQVGGGFTTINKGQPRRFAVTVSIDTEAGKLNCVSANNVENVAITY
jgi:hypothetical protein